MVGGAGDEEMEDLSGSGGGGAGGGASTSLSNLALCLLDNAVSHPFPHPVLSPSLPPSLSHSSFLCICICVGYATTASLLSICGANMA